MKVLVSLTNKFGNSKKDPNICLLEIDSENKKIAPILTEHENLPKQLTGIAALTYFQNQVIFFTDRCQVGILDKNYQVTKTWGIPIEYAHSAIEYDNKLYIAASSVDGVIQSDPNRNIHVSYWQANNDRKDTLHINSIARDQNNFYITGFGKRGDFWHTAQNGFIKNITTGETLIDGLKQPHTLICYLNKPYSYLYYCNSATSEVKCITTNQKNPQLSNNSLLIDSDSYVRGMCFSPDHKTLAVATSKGRKKSKSTGKDLITNFTDKGESTGHCAIHFYKSNIDYPNLFDYKHFETIILDDWGIEIYDVLNVTNYFNKHKTESSWWRQKINKIFY